MINDNTSQRFDNSITKKSEHFRLRLFYSIIHSKGIEPLSQEPESCVISITLRVVTIILYHIKIKRKDLLNKSFLILNYNSISPNKSAIEKPVCVSGSS